MATNPDEDKRRKMLEWQLLDSLRDQTDPNSVIDNWVMPLENYRDDDSFESGEVYRNPVLCEFGELTRLMLWYYNVVTTRLYPNLTESIDADSVKNEEAKVRKCLMDAATSLLKILDAES